jgi:hypothetical protein
MVHPAFSHRFLPWFLRQALTSGDADMSKAQDPFDTVGIVADWIDACKQQRLDVLLDLYEDAAIIESCEGGTFRGRSAMEWYWRSKLAGPAAFEVDALCPEPDGVSLDYRGYDGKPVRTHFRFNAGKITLTTFATIKQAA